MATFYLVKYQTFRFEICFLGGCVFGLKDNILKDNLKSYSSGLGSILSYG